MSPRRSRLPKVWIWSSISLVGAVVLSLLWWQSQLPARLAQAVENDQLDTCLRLGEQLAALRKLNSEEQAIVAGCLREQASRNWQQQRLRLALDQQRQLVLRSGNPAVEERRLQQWRQQIQRQAMEAYQRGDARQALDLLTSSGETRFTDGQQLHATLEDHWAANRYAYSQAASAAAGEDWWKALDQLNQLNHPWWQRKATSLRTDVSRQAAAMQRSNQPKDSHRDSGDQPISDTELDAAVQRHLSLGLSAWQAFELGCSELGGQVLEHGPESSCQR